MDVPKPRQQLARALKAARNRAQFEGKRNHGQKASGIPIDQAALMLSQEIGQQLSVGMLYKYESDSATTAIPRDIVKAAEKVYGVSLSEASFVYYNDNDANDSGPDPATLERILRLASRQRVYKRVPIVSGTRIWSAKSVSAETVAIFAVLGAAREMIKIGQEGVKGVKPGTLLIFEPVGEHDSPPYDTWLWIENRANPDQNGLRYISSSGKPDQLLSDVPDLPALSLADWRVTGWAWGKAEPKGGMYPKYELLEMGIGPEI